MQRRFRAVLEWMRGGVARAVDTPAWRNATVFTIGVIVGVGFTLAVPRVFSSANSLEDGELVILSGRDDSANSQRQELINQWNDLHPKNRARIVELSGRADAQHSEMVARAQSGGSGVDIYNLDVTWTAEFAARDFVRPVNPTELDLSGFLAKPLETCRYDGQLWALPFNTDAGLLYYRTDVVSSPPESWSRLKRQIDEALADPQRRAAGLAGYTGQLANYEGLTVNALEAIWAEGGNVVNADGDVVIDQTPEETQLGLARLRPSSTGMVVLPESLSYDEGASTEAFSAGKVVFMRNWPVAYRSLDAQVAEGAVAARVPFAAGALPGPSALGGQNLAVARGSPEPRAAQALIEYLTDARSQQLLFERGGLAATREIVYRDRAVLDRYKYAQVLLESIQRSRLRPATPYYSRFSEVFRNGVYEALRDGKPLAADFAERLRDALKGR